MAREHYETLQQVFDDAYLGLAAQGFVRSVRHDWNGASIGCAYRGDEGRRCALGHCIPDARYTNALEGYFGGDLPKNLPGLFSDAIGDGALVALQNSHDYAISPDRMKSELENFARVSGLTVPDISSAA